MSSSTRQQIPPRAPRRRQSRFPMHMATLMCSLCTALPLGVRPADNQNGWSHSLAKLAALLEAGYIASADASMPGRPLELALDSFAGQRCSIHEPEQLSLIPRAGFPFARPLLRRLSTPSRASGGTFGVRQYGSVRTTCSGRWPTCRVRCAYFRPSHGSNLHFSLQFPHTIPLHVATPHRSGMASAPDLLTVTSTTSHLIPLRHLQPPAQLSNQEAASNSGDVCRQVPPAERITRWPPRAVRRQCVGNQKTMENSQSWTRRQSLRRRSSPVRTSIRSAWRGSLQNSSDSATYRGRVSRRNACSRNDRM